MFLEVDGLKINYKFEGSGKPAVLMHGWGQNLEMMDFIFNHLKDNYKVLSFDFLGFGKSDEPNRAFSVEDYKDVLRKMFEILNIENPILIAHSFGCRVAFRYASEYSVDKMVLTGAAGIREELSFMAKLKMNSYKMIKKILIFLGMEEELKSLQDKVGSSDYKNSSGIMRATFVKVVNDDVRNILDKIDCPTLLVWGENDEAVSLKSARIIEKKIKDCALVIFENDDHFAYFHQWQRFNSIIDAMLKED